MPTRENVRPPPASTGPRASVWRWVESRGVAAVLLVVFWFALVLAWRDKGWTYDEANHALGGLTYWRLGDYRINPENGNLPQRIAGLALVAADAPAPVIDTPAWRSGDQWTVSHDWLYATGGAEPDRWLRSGRAVMAVLAVALAAATWWWARRLYGPRGGFVALLLCVLSPMLLANGPLIASDTAAALCFLAATGAYWRLLHRVTPARMALAGAASAALALSKMSAVLLFPVGAVLLVARLVSREPLPWSLGRSGETAPRLRRAGWLVGATFAHLLVAWTLIWAAYGFRYSSFAPSLAAGSRPPASFEQLLGYLRPFELLDDAKLTDAQTERALRIFRAHGATSEDWTAESRAAFSAVEREVLVPAQRATVARAKSENTAGNAGRLIELSRDLRLLPEAFLLGVAHARAGAQGRASFLDGEVRPTGRADYFPRTLLYKNPAPVFAIAALAVFAAWIAWRAGDATSRRAGFYATLPLWSLVIVYWSFLLPSGLNIGHRHALPVYAPCFILCGAAAAWWTRTDRLGRRAGGVLAGLLALLAVEVAWSWPNSPSYFSAVFGGAAQGYRRVADSSLDWGQELPSVRRYIEKDGSAEPLFLSYFGNDSPRHYGVSARLLPSFSPWDNDRRPVISYHRMPTGERRGFLARLVAEQPEFELLAEATGESQYECAVVRRAETLRLVAGTYLISAAMFQPFDFGNDGPFGPWCARHEQVYQELRAIAAPLLVDDPAARQALLDRLPVAEIAQAFRRYEIYRFHRLTAWLRKNRQPTDVINGAVLVFRLSRDDIQQALEGAPPELGRDLAAEYRAELLRQSAPGK